MGWRLPLPLRNIRLTAGMSWKLSKKKLIESFYPGVRREAQKVLGWISAKKIILTGYDDTYRGIRYEGNRTPEGKEPTAYKVSP
jgi:hypothetical protein